MGGPPALGLNKGLTTHQKEPASYEVLHRASDLQDLVNTIMNPQVP